MLYNINRAIMGLFKCMVVSKFSFVESHAAVLARTLLHGVCLHDDRYPMVVSRVTVVECAYSPCL